MTLLATRDALTKMLDHFVDRRGQCSCGKTLRDMHPDTIKEHVVDEALASGVVIDAAALADDDALLERVARTWAGGSWAHRRPAVRKGDVTRARGWLRALAAALSERAP